MVVKTKRAKIPKIVTKDTQMRYNLRKRALKRVSIPKPSPLQKTKKIKKKQKKVVKKLTISKPKVKPVLKNKNKKIKLKKVSSLGKRVIKLPDETFVQKMLSSLKLRCEIPKQLRPKIKKRSLNKVKQQRKQQISNNTKLSIKPLPYVLPFKIPTKKPASIKNKSKSKTKTVRIMKKTPIQIYDSNTGQQISEKLSPTLPKMVKYMGKSIMQIEKQKQREKMLYLVKAEKKQGLWTLHITQNPGRIYQVRIDSVSIRCSCIHFRMTKKCQEINFVSNKILENDQFINHLKYKNEISQEIFDKIDQQLYQRLFFYFEKDTSKKDLTIFERKCFVCFDILATDSEPIQKCEKCDIKFHKRCFEAYKKSQKDCLFCKGTSQCNEEKQKLVEQMEQIKV